MRSPNKRQVMICPQCSHKYALRQYQPSKQYHCKKCGTVLENSQDRPTLMLPDQQLPVEQAPRKVKKPEPAANSGSPALCDDDFFAEQLPGTAANDFTDQALEHKASGADDLEDEFWNDQQPATAVDNFDELLGNQEPAAAPNDFTPEVGADDKFWDEAPAANSPQGWPQDTASDEAQQAAPSSSRRGLSGNGRRAGRRRAGRNKSQTQPPSTTKGKLTLIMLIGGVIFVLAISVTYYLWEYSQQQSLKRLLQVAERLQQAGVTNQALKLYHEILEQHPGYVRAQKKIQLLQKLQQLLEQARQQESTGQLEQARATYQKVLQINAQEEHALAGIQRLQLRQTREQVTEYQKKAHRERLKREKLQRLRNAQHKAAEEYVRGRLRLSSFRPNRVDLLLAQRYFAQAIQQAPDFAAAYYQKGYIAQLLMNFPAAVASYQKCLSKDPHFYQAYLQLAKIYALGEGCKYPPNILRLSNKLNYRCKLIKQLINRLVLVSKSPPNFYYNMLNLYHLALTLNVNRHAYNGKQTHQIIRKCWSLMHTYPYSPEPYLLLVRLCSFWPNVSYIPCLDCQISPLSNFSLAFQTLKRLLIHFPQCAEAYHLRAALYMAAGDFQLAKRDLSHALRLCPYQAMVYLLRGICQFSLGHDPQALADFNMAIRLGVNQAYFFRSMLYLITSHPQKARSDLQVYTRKQTHGAIENKNWQKFIQSFIYFSLGDEESGSQVFKRFSKGGGQIQEYLQLLGVFNSMFMQGGQRGTDFDLFLVQPKLKKQLEQFSPMLQGMSGGAGSGKHNFGMTPDLQIFSALLGRWRESFGNNHKVLENFQIAIQENMGLSLSPIFISYAIPFYLNIFAYKQSSQVPLFSDYHLYYQRALSYYLWHKLSEARRDLEVVLDFQEDAVAGHYGYATILALQANTNHDPRLKARALYHLKRALQLGWQHSEYLSKDDNFKSLRQEAGLRQLLQHKPVLQSSPAELTAEIRQLLRNGQLTQALRRLKKCRPQQLSPHLCQLRERLAAKCYQYFLSQLETAINLSNDSQLLNYLWTRVNILLPERRAAFQHAVAKAYLEYGLQQSSLEKISRALDWHPDYVKAYIKRGDLFYRKGDRNAAWYDWETALSLQPELYAELQSRLKQAGH